LGILWTFGEHFIVRDDLVLGFLHFNQFAELVALARGWGSKIESTFTSPELSKA